MSLHSLLEYLHAMWDRTLSWFHIPLGILLFYLLMTSEREREIERERERERDQWHLEHLNDVSQPFLSESTTFSLPFIIQLFIWRTYVFSSQWEWIYKLFSGHTLHLESANSLFY